MRDPQSITVNDDERMIPVWSIVVASLAFVLVEYYFWVVAPEQRHHAPPPIGFRIYFNLSWGIVVALYFLMVGYISKDAPRRGMNTRFWMLVCFVMPGGIGAVHSTFPIVTAFARQFRRGSFKNSPAQYRRIRGVSAVYWPSGDETTRIALPRHDY